MPRAPLRRAILGAALLGLACSKGRGGPRSPEDARREAFAPGVADPAGERGPRFDPSRPLDVLRLDAGALAAQVGSFTWEGRVAWTASREGIPPVRATETHSLRQLASGEFEASSRIDPGTDAGAITGRQVVFTGGRSYARGEWAPWRVRDADRGDEARRHRDESFGLLGSLATLGGGLAAEPAGEVTLLGRRALRYTLGPRAAAPPVAPPAPAAPPKPEEADSQRRIEFLRSASPRRVEGELLLDGASGLPLRARLRATYVQPGDPGLAVEVELAADVTELGRGVKAIRVPQDFLADERRPKGVARALETAGFKKGPRPATMEDEGPAADEVNAP